MEQELEKSNSNNTKWEWLPKKHIYHLVGVCSLSILLLIIFSFPFFGENSLFWTIIFFAQVVTIWQTNIISVKTKKRAFHIHSRGIYALCLATGMQLRSYFLYDNLEIDKFLYQFLFLWAISGITSLIIFFIPSKLFNDSRYYIIRFTRFIFPIALIFVGFLIIIEEGWLNSDKGEIIKWDDTQEMSFEDFGGYPDLFSDFGSSIRSQIVFDFDSYDKLIKIDAICHKDRTWVNPWDKDSYSLLQHEVYHFNITEMVTRMARKEVYEAIGNGADKWEIKTIITKHQKLLRKTQNEYDTETDHNLISDKQSIWQYRVDSILDNLDSYWTSEIFQHKSESDTVCFRNLLINDKNEITGANTLMPNEEEYTRHYKFIYDESNILKKIVSYSFGKITTDNQFEVAIIKLENKGNGDVIWKFYDKNSTPILCNEGYHSKTISIIDNQQMNIKYYDTTGKETKHKQGQYESKMKLDELGRMTDQKYYDEKGAQITDNRGFYHRKYYYKGKRNFSYMDKNYDSNKKPLLDNKRRSQRFYSYNKDGQMTYSWAKDIHGKYVFNNGHAIFYYEYNELGMYISATLMDEKKELVEDENGIAKYEFIEDRYGNVIRRSYFNSNEVLTKNSDGNAMIITKYDKNNNLTTQANYDTGCILVFDDNTYGKVKYKYDNKNRKKVITNLSAYGTPFKTRTAGPIEVLEYDSLGRVIKGSYFDAFNNPDTSSLGVSHYTMLSDKNDNMIELKQYGLNNQLINTHNDVSIFRYSFDKNNNKTKASYYTVEDFPAFANQGAFINEYKYSQDNNRIERSYYDTTNNLIEFDGYAKIKWKYDEKSNVIETKYFNKENSLVKIGTAILTQVYDSSNNVIEQCEYDCKGGEIVKRKYVYDKRGNEISVSNYTTDDNAIGNEKNVHQYLYSYSLDNKSMGESYIDSKGNLIELENGVAEVKIIRDPRGNVSIRKSLNKINELVIDSEEGYAIVKYQYDLYDRIIREEFFDTEEKLIDINEHYATVKYSRDNSGNILNKCFYNKFNNLTEDKDSVALYTYEYNRNGVLIDSKTSDLEKAKDHVKEHIR
ncbi:MAG: hypothetical protein HRT73_01510 [Flavobacteriales bacterium]|nr:hypothetical protein [Flavobacteriales bacterium]